MTTQIIKSPKQIQSPEKSAKDERETKSRSRRLEEGTKPSKACKPHVKNSKSVNKKPVAHDTGWKKGKERTCFPDTPSFSRQGVLGEFTTNVQEKAGRDQLETERGRRGGSLLGCGLGSLVRQKKT